MRPLRPLLAAVSLTAFLAVGFAFTRAAANWREYRWTKKPDPSAAELYLDTAEVWGGAGLVALAIGAVAAAAARARR